MRSVEHRISALESSLLACDKPIKAFVFHAEASPSYWSPEDPEAWKTAHLKGKAVLLKRDSCRVVN